MRNSINDLTSKVGIIETQKINELSQRINLLAEKNLDTRLSELEQINLTNDFPKSLKSLVDAKY
jgi:DNA-binding HxlR family transcriptional regulator